MTVPEEAVALAAKAVDALWGGRYAPHEVEELGDEMRAALAAAVPVIEKQLRARLADEIEAQEKPPDVEGSRVMGWLIGRSDAARLVRGAS